MQCSVQHYNLATRAHLCSSLEMAIDAQSSDIVSPKGKISIVWQHFGYSPGDKDMKKQRVSYALCGVCVVHGGGTTNLKIHTLTCIQI